MRFYILPCLVVFVMLYAQSDEKPMVGRQKIPVESSNPYGFPTEVKVNPDIQLKTGLPPALPELDIERLKANLRPETAEKITNIQYGKVKNLKEISYSRAEALASYKAMIIRQIAEQELKDLVKRGATDKDVETFKIQTDERILKMRLEIMKAFGKPEEIKETEEAILKFKTYKDTKLLKEEK